MNNWYTIDPGLSGFGIAMFNDRKLMRWHTYYPKGKTFKEKADDSLICVRRHISPYDRVFIEYPSYQTLAAQNTGSIVKLAYAIGVLCGWYKNSVLIPVVSWKGQLPKIVVQKRAEKFFGQKGFKSHASDAIGLGQYVIKNNLI